MICMSYSYNCNHDIKMVYLHGGGVDKEYYTNNNRELNRPLPSGQGSELS